jgi:hypothetical protein
VGDTTKQDTFGNGAEGATSSARIRRRGLIAGAAILTAGLLARQTAQPVGATDGNNLIIGAGGDANNVSTTTTTLASTATIALKVTSASDGTTIKGTANGANASAVEGITDLGEGILGAVGPSVGTGGTGVHGQGLNASSTAVYGESNGDSGVGVYGLTEAANSTGVFGDVYLNGSTAVGGRVRPGGTNSFGVYGEVNETGGAGIFGTSFNAGSPAISGSHTNGIAVQGVATSSNGVLGRSTSSDGVRGESTGGNGVYGFANAPGSTQIVAGVFGDSTTTYGLLGRTTAAGYSSLTAITSSPGVAALAATSTVNTAYAAYLQGATVVQGDFIAFQGVKSAAVKDASGQHRLVYCVESPESWFEDFGKGQLVNGKATVTLDPVFAQIAHTDDYHVFLTAYDAPQLLYVTARSASGFSVQADKASVSGAFSYRVVAKRADIKGERLAKFNLPKINFPDPAKLPKAGAAPATTPKPPKLPNRPRPIKQK